MVSIRVPLLDVLTSFRPEGAVETADVTVARELAATAPNPWARTTPLHVTASALIVHPATGRVLLRWHPRQRSWLQIGGHGDPGETDPIEIAIREGTEETGLTDLKPWPDASLIHVVVVPVPANHREPAHEHVDLRFVLATEEPDAARPEEPDAPVRWLTMADAHSLTGEDNVAVTLTRTETLLTTYAG